MILETEVSNTQTTHVSTWYISNHSPGEAPQADVEVHCQSKSLTDRDRQDFNGHDLVGWCAGGYQVGIGGL